MKRPRDTRAYVAAAMAGAAMLLAFLPPFVCFAAAVVAAVAWSAWLEDHPELAENPPTEGSSLSSLSAGLHRKAERKDRSFAVTPAAR